uniref:U2A'/phosphoprotein 32 family A C-terminal domain-containing protein n=1 Tax=Aegilops tauschii subsp. strangulata TaxID=200361 RepID=A0A453MJ57_AEGTS
MYFCSIPCLFLQFSLLCCHVEFLPKMHTLVLTNNRLTSLAEIDPLASLPKLQFLSLLDNTVTKQPDYRLYVIHKLKHLRLLDFKKVKQQVSNHQILITLLCLIFESSVVRLDFLVLMLSKYTSAQCQ